MLSKMEGSTPMFYAVRKLARFALSPTGALIAVGLMLLVAALTSGSWSVSLIAGAVGALLVLTGLGRRLTRADDGIRALDKRQFDQRRDLTIAVDTTGAANQRLTDDIGAVGTGVEGLQREVERVSESIVRRLRAAEIRITESGRDADAFDKSLENRLAGLERRLDDQSKERQKDRSVIETMRDDTLREQRARERQIEKDRTAQVDVSISDIRLAVLGGNTDADWYNQRSVHEERQSPLYDLVRQGGFQSFVDVGANYGFVSILAKRAAPNIRVVAIEADPRLIPLIHTNLERNGVTDADVIHAIAGREVNHEATFSLNPDSTLDNRVNMGSWDELPVKQTTVDAIISELDLPSPIFFKIDTQGFEAEVLAGCQAHLTGRHDWMIKMEFGPMWLRSQSIDPNAFLAELCTRYEVAEFPARIAFAEPSLDGIFRIPLDPSAATAFVQYIVSLNRHSRGWVDLLVRPRGGE